MGNEFFNWWFSQLAEALPLMPAGPTAASSILDIHVTRHDIRLSWRGQDELLVPRGEETSQRQQIQIQLGGSEHAPDWIRLHLAEDCLLRRDVVLPIAALDNLTETIELQLDQLTPFDPSQARFFHSPPSVSEDGERLTTSLIVIPEKHLQRVYELLHTLMPEDLPKPEKSDGRNLLVQFPANTRIRHRVRRRRMTQVLLAAILAISLAGLHIHRQRQHLDYLQENNREVQKQAAQASKAEQALQHLEKQVRLLQNIQQNSLRLHELLLELDRRLPEDTWLQALEYHDGQLRLQGISEQASALISRLEKSPLLSHVAFASATQPDQASGSEHFNISALVQTDTLEVHP